MQGTEYTLDFDEISLDTLPRVGGKNASLGEMIRSLGDAGIRVPDGFAITGEAFTAHLRSAGLESSIYPMLHDLNVDDTRALSTTSQEIRRRIRGAALPERVAEELRQAYHALSAKYDEPATDVAVRSSATAEDLPTASFAGQQETYLNIRGAKQLEEAVVACMASLFTDRAIVYRAQQGIRHEDVLLSVGVQKMVRSDEASAGVIFTLDPETGFRDVVTISGAWGLGEVVVQGRVKPDEFCVHKPTLRTGHRAVLRRDLGDKACKLIYADGPARAVKEVRVPAADRRRFVLDEDEVLQLARWAMEIEDHYSRRAGCATPMDLEWAKDGRTGELFIVQARPETVHSRAGPPRIEIYQLRGGGQVLVRGKSVGNRIGAGPVRVVHSPEDLHAFQTGEVLVAEMTDPDWDPVLRRAAGVVTDQGGRTCHAAIVSRELGIPCVVGTGAATGALRDGQEVTVCCGEGAVGTVYEGRLDYSCEEIDPAELPEPRIPLMLNVANPDQVFRLAQLPCAGVGLLRLEFLVSNWIGIHPMALLHSDRVPDHERAEIRRRLKGYASGADFFVERLASGIAQIAAAFFPRPVIVRLSDYKTNEYAGLVGGRVFEPDEANPMIGFRGASRYYDDRYREGFALECAAIRRVRETIGLTNAKVMVPFCRTLDEGRRVLEELARNGVRRGENGLEVYVMCEIPNNVILATEFSDLFDGFSIGSNDLTQLTLGVDRDSELLAHIFDERDPGVRRMIEMVVRDAHAKGRPVGLCGQAPSDYPEFAEFLASLGIDSISLTPDALAGVARRLASTEAPVAS